MSGSLFAHFGTKWRQMKAAGDGFRRSTTSATFVLAGAAVLVWTALAMAADPVGPVNLGRIGGAEMVGLLATITLVAAFAVSIIIIATAKATGDQRLPALAVAVTAAVASSFVSAVFAESLSEGWLSEMGGFRRLVLAVGLGSMLAFVARGREFSRRALVGTAFLAVLIVLIPVLGNLAFVVGYVLAGSWLIRTGLDSDRPAVWSAGLLLFAVVLGDVVAMGAELASPRSVEATLIVFLGVLAAVGGASTELRRGFLAQSSLVDELQLATALHGARAAELGHEQRSALVAIEGALTKLRVDGSSLTAIDFSRLTNAAASEIERLRRMVGTASEPSVVGRIGIGELLRPYLACQQARGVAILVDIDPDVEVVVKHDEFTRIVQNLVENAHHHGDAPTIEVSASCQRGEVTVIVADNGPGIPQALFDVIFDAGVSSDPINRSGLGLSICRRILTDMQGTIDVSDRVGGGCVFTIRLPEAGHSSASQDLPAPIWAAKAAG